MKRFKNILSRLAIVTVALAMSMPAAFAAPQWTALNLDTTSAKTIVKDPEIEILTLPSVIFVHISQTSKIEVFTILGRLVSSEVLAPGSYEFHSDAHGVFIVKIKDITCKVAI